MLKRLASALVGLALALAPLRAHAFPTTTLNTADTPQCRPKQLPFTTIPTMGAIGHSLQQLNYLSGPLAVPATTQTIGGVPATFTTGTNPITVTSTAQAATGLNVGNGFSGTGIPSNDYITAISGTSGNYSFTLAVAPTGNSSGNYSVNLNRFATFAAVSGSNIITIQDSGVTVETLGLRLGQNIGTTSNTSAFATGLAVAGILDDKHVVISANSGATGNVVLGFLSSQLNQQSYWTYTNAIVGVLGQVQAELGYFRFENYNADLRGWSEGGNSPTFMSGGDLGYSGSVTSDTRARLEEIERVGPDILMLDFDANNLSNANNTNNNIAIIDTLHAWCRSMPMLLMAQGSYGTATATQGANNPLRVAGQAMYANWVKQQLASARFPGDASVVTLNPGTTTSNVAFGETVNSYMVQNTGSRAAWVLGGTSSGVTAQATSQSSSLVVAPGNIIEVACYQCTYLAGITASGSTTLSITPSKQFAWLYYVDGFTPTATDTSAETFFNYNFVLSTSSKTITPLGGVNPYQTGVQAPSTTGIGNSALYTDPLGNTCQQTVTGTGIPASTTTQSMSTAGVTLNNFPTVSATETLTFTPAYCANQGSAPTSFYTNYPQTGTGNDVHWGLYGSEYLLAAPVINVLRPLISSSLRSSASSNIYKSMTGASLLAADMPFLTGASTAVNKNLTGTGQVTGLTASWSASANTITISSYTAGQLGQGMLANCTGLPANTYISAPVTSTTVSINTTTSGTGSGATCTFEPSVSGFVPADVTATLGSNSLSSTVMSIASNSETGGNMMVATIYPLGTGTTIETLTFLPTAIAINSTAGTGQWRELWGEFEIDTSPGWISIAPQDTSRLLTYYNNLYFSAGIYGIIPWWTAGTARIWAHTQCMFFQNNETGTQPTFVVKFNPATMNSPSVINFRQWQLRVCTPSPQWYQKPSATNDNFPHLVKSTALADNDDLRLRSAAGRR